MAAIFRSPDPWFEGQYLIGPLIVSFANPLIILPAVLGGFVLRRWRRAVPALALIVPILSTLYGLFALYRAGGGLSWLPLSLLPALIPAAAFWAWAGRRFGGGWDSRRSA